MPTSRSTVSRSTMTLARDPLEHNCRLARHEMSFEIDRSLQIYSRAASNRPPMRRRGAKLARGRAKTLPG